MLRRFENEKAQMVAGEYVLVFFVVVAMLSGMTMYFRRAVQAKIRDAHSSIITTVRNRVGNIYGGNDVFVQYEPYYRNSVTDTTTLFADTTAVLPSLPLSSGIFRKDYNQTTFSNSVSFTVPAINAD